MLFSTLHGHALRILATLLLMNSATAIAADKTPLESAPEPVVQSPSPVVVYSPQGPVSQWSIAPIPAARLYGYSTTLSYGHPFYYGPPVYPQPYQYGTYYSPVGGYGHPTAYPTYTGYYGYPPYAGPMSWVGAPLVPSPIPPSPPVTR